MSFILEFYKELDTINLIIFWGVIIVVLLLLTFAIIIANKNKKLEKIIEKSGIDINEFDTDNELAIKKEETISKEELPINNNIEVKKEEPLTITKEEVIVNNNRTQAPNQNNSVVNNTPSKEEKFVVEELVMEYNKDALNHKTIENQIAKKESDEPSKNIIRPSEPYQKNVLREISSNQTSPIGVAKMYNESDKEKNNAIELHKILNEPDNNIESNRDVRQEESLINQKKYISSYTQNPRKGDYLEELSKKLESASKQNDINRTEYELRQEEDAIISYEELMQKRDSIKTIDEEDAVISLEELIERKKKEEKLYNITKEEPDDKFINELKHFRSDL